MLPTLLLAPLVTSAFAEDTPVLVSALQPRNAEAAGLASLIETVLARELAHDADLRVIRVEDTPAFDNYSARTYMEGCPAGEIVGCTLVIGQRSDAAYAVTGTVRALADGNAVTIEIIDVRGSRSVFSFETQLDPGSDQKFAAGVAKVLSAAIAGELDEKDIRDSDEPAPKDHTAAARELAALSRELGGPAAVVHDDNELIKRPAYTAEDLAKQVKSEGSAPWERLGMSAAEYLRYKNSGRNLVEWRERSMGRAGQIVVSPWAGALNGPWSGEYYGRYAYDVVGGGFQVVDTYSTQVVQSGTGGAGGVSVGYGLLPVLEVGATVGVVGGKYAIDVDQVTVGAADKAPRDPEMHGNSTLLFGPRAELVILPQSTVRPAFGAALLFAAMSGADDKVELPSELQTFPAGIHTLFEGSVGGEVRLGRTMDFFARVPLQVHLSGDLTQKARNGTVDAVDVVEPDEASAVGAGFEAGLHIRIGGRKPKETRDYEEIEE